MDITKGDLDNLKDELLKLSNYLKDIDSENFNEKFPKIKSQCELIHNTKIELSKRYTNFNKTTYNDLFKEIIKQINDCFDSELEKLKNEQGTVAEQLKLTNNQKKLAQYR